MFKEIEFQILIFWFLQRPLKPFTLTFGFKNVIFITMKHGKGGNINEEVI